MGRMRSASYVLTQYKFQKESCIIQIGIEIILLTEHLKISVPIDVQCNCLEIAAAVNCSLQCNTNGEHQSSVVRQICLDRRVLFKKTAIEICSLMPGKL